MSIFEYNQEAHLRRVAEENRADGWEDGWNKLAAKSDSLEEFIRRM